MTYDTALSVLRTQVEGLGVWLAVWGAREDGKPDAHARRCAGDAVAAIDGALRELYGIRAQLVGEIRASDDAAAARADAVLAEGRQGRREVAGDFPLAGSEAESAQRAYAREEGSTP